ncbi:MAG: hypothetical protein ACO1OF_12810 [Adhaeribacter sp.]
MDVLVPTQDAELFTNIYPNSGKETIILLQGSFGIPDGLTFIYYFICSGKRPYALIL